MSSEQWKISAEVVGLQARGWFKNCLRLVAIGIVLIGGYNMLIAPFSAAPALLTEIYRPVVAQFVNGGGEFLSDILLMVIGACVAWFF